MGKFQDLTGKKFGRLLVIERVENNKKQQVQWLCKCDCGNEVKVISKSLTSGNTKSCGCLHREINIKRLTTHGLRNTRLNGIWCGVLQRCYNPKNKAYKNYGGRGITVCQEWQDNFQNFYDWSMSNGYNDDLTIDRIDVNGNYEPSNCRWVTKKEQANNMRSNRLLTYNGETHNMKQWAKIMGINYRALQQRLFRGWSIEKALTTPLKKRKDNLL